MKTPKRQNGLPRVVNILNQQHTRWKRKNREAQYKRTIKRLKEENNHLKQALTVRTWEDMKAGMMEHFEWINKHFEVHYTQPTVAVENNNLIIKQETIFKWDKQVITVHYV